MTFLPIVSRELRVASRRSSTYWIRAGAAFWVLVLGTWFFLMLQNMPSHEASLVLFGVLAGSAVLHSLLSGVRLTSDSLSQEKREGTLGLLFLTDLHGYDVVLGKLVASSVDAFYSVLAAMPLLAVPILLGGVTPGEFGRMALLALNSMFLSLAAGMALSSISRSARASASLTFLLLLAVTGLLPAMGFWLESIGKVHSRTPFLLPSAGFGFYAAFDMNYAMRAPWFWWSVGVQQALAWMALAVAAMVAPRSWQDRPPGLKALRARDRWLLWSAGKSDERAAFRKRMLDRNPFLWLMGRHRFKPMAVWLVLAVLGCVWAWGLEHFRDTWLSEPCYISTGLALNALLKFWVAADSGRQLAEERQRGTLELLLSTPITVREIMGGHLRALRRHFQWPAALVFLLFAVFMASYTSEMDASDRPDWFYFWGAAMLMLPLDLLALHWVGMWQGLTAKSPNRVGVGSITRVLLLPWGGIALTICVLAVLAASNRTSFDPSARFFVNLWFFLGLTADVVFASWARYKLLRRFRIAAAERFEVRSSFWKRWLHT